MSDITTARRQQDEKDAPKLLAALMQLQTELTQEFDALRSSNETDPQIAVIQNHLITLEANEIQLRAHLRSARWALARIRQERETWSRA